VLKKRIMLFLLLATAFIVLMIFICNKIITDNARGKLYGDSKSIPFNRVGLLLGTAPYLTGGKHNPYYVYRVEAAAKLLKENKIKYLVISGDNSRADYNEPLSMRTDLINAGIDSSVIFLDYAGFRTFDSIVRLKEIFGQDSVTVISQRFHNERAIYTASKKGISAIGFNATGINYASDVRIQLREKLARVKVFLDCWFGKKPKFSGKTIKIPV
jgi:SanA protein